MRHYERATQLDESMIDAKTNLAALCIRMGDVSRALVLCEEVLVPFSLTLTSLYPI